MFRRHACSISAGDAWRIGRSLRWTCTLARWLPLASPGPVTVDVPDATTLPARMASASNDSPGSCSFIA